MPQWSFLNFLAEQGKNYPSFHLRMRTQAAELTEEEGRVTGVRADGPDGRIEICTDLTVGCDGRHSTVRVCSGLTVEELGAPMDALWFWLPKHANDPVKTTSSLEAGRSIVLMNRGDDWQCALMILKGSIDETRRAGLPALRAEIAQLVPAFADRVDVLADWDQIKLLTVAVNRLERWYRPGLLCIGDAAHAMSPLLGVGLGLAVQDAVAAANILWRPLATGTLREADLERVQKRREFPTRLTQGIQMRMHKSIDRALQQADDRALAGANIGSAIGGPAPSAAPSSATGRDGCAPRARAYPSNRRCGRRWRACLGCNPGRSVAIALRAEARARRSLVTYRDMPVDRESQASN